ncbi:hypothetical protein OG225_42485 (plasmid) [Nocardia sp. NBC_01377]|uniref:hypothetical protein n=1 Tax=Nocardia sp. NBC_01377 TaxID=2903595 RepID=UPI002F91306E
MSEDIESTIHALNGMCCGENLPPDAKTVREWDAIPNTPEPKQGMLERLVCGSCLGLRFGPGHLVRKYMIGVCDA